MMNDTFCHFSWMFSCHVWDVIMCYGHPTEKKKKYSGGGMKYTAMAMANRAT